MPGKRLILYSPVVTSRLRYIANHLIAGMIGFELIITDNKNDAVNADLPVINYSHDYLPEAINVIPSGLLSEISINPEKPVPAEIDGLLVLYPSDGPDDIGFDLFAASFYLLSRYEEYISFKADIHGRFPFHESMAHKYQIYDDPLVDLWVERFKKAISRMYRSVSFPGREFSFIPTIDVDVPYAYKNRPFWRIAGGFGRSLLKLDINDALLRYKVLSGQKSDPYDTFGLIKQVHDEFEMSPVFFFSAGAYGKYDKSSTIHNSEYRNLIANLSEAYKWGIHPSYKSFEDDILLSKEIESLGKITGSHPFRSRQHYLRYRLPETCRILAENGVSEDYTMGWAEMTGFRAGTCTPFNFYDLEREEATVLKIFPFQIMDGTLCDYLKLTPEQAVDHSLKVITKIKSVNGTLITLWHNETFSGIGRWKEWNKVYNEILKAAVL
jgi:hypothetical protein